MEMPFIFMFLLCSGLISVSDGNDSKRLLLNDPTIFQDRLNRMESMLTIQQNTVKQQTVTIQQQDSKIQQQADAIIDRYGISVSQITTYKNPFVVNTSRSFPHSFKHGFVTRLTRWVPLVEPELLTLPEHYSGGSYDQSGSASDYVCLSPDPKFLKTSGLDFGRMYGAEYETNFWAANFQDEDGPCALCRTAHATTVMIPGTNVCNNGWNRQYYEYLASGYYGYAAASSFVCVDVNPQYRISGVGDQNGKLFYNVLAKCGSLPCPPYINDHPLTCVVCSK